HRLDRETSGVMLLARNPEAHQALNEQFAAHQVSKLYRALVAGQPDWDEQLVDLPLRTQVGRRNRTAVDPEQGKPASTHFKVLERLPAGALLEARPLTGRMHQIRAHLYALGLAILSDPLYGSGEPSAHIARLALHASRISCWHPRSGALLQFEAPEPSDFCAALAVMRAEC
ncbi:MAG: RluA family pseudouridine synthase, partial [Anaerolineales bacterium]|nr:RluA family pseudouridine synthase [Anaerolineales bacterium]